MLLPEVSDGFRCWCVVQANVSRKKAVKALKSAEGDIVSAIMELTM